MLSALFCGVIIFGNILKYLSINFKIPTYCCFAGLILGGIPSIIRESQAKKIKFYHILALLLTLSFSLYLVAIEHFFTLFELASTSFASFVLAGFGMSAGVVIPGISSTVILLLFGKYELYLSAISTLNFSILFPMGIGLLLGCIILLYIIRFLLTYFKSITYFSIIGFVLGSIPILIPNISSIYEFIIGLIFCIFGFVITAIVCNKTSTNKAT